jgi:subtilisin family serine protease
VESPDVHVIDHSRSHLKLARVFKPAFALTGLLAMSLIVACTSDDAAGEDGADGEEPRLAVEITGLVAEHDDGEVRLRWDEASDVPAYRVGYDGFSVEVPAAICAQACELAVEPASVGAVEIAVSAMRDGAVSEPALVTVDVTAPDDEPDEESLEVLLVFAGERPEVETIPVESIDEAEQLIENAEIDALNEGRQLLSATLNVSGRSPSAGSDEGAEAGPAWQAEAMEFDSLPGDPPGRGVTVAILDEGGVDAAHPALRDAMILPGHHVSDASLTGVDQPGDHATSVASMIVGQPGSAVPGIAPGATILPVDLAGGRVDGLIEAMIWAVDNGADIITVPRSYSCARLGPFALPCRVDNAVRAGTDYAEANGVVVVASAGNDGPGADYCHTPTNGDNYPAIVDTVFSVGGHDRTGATWVCSPDRPDVDVLAPSAELLAARTSDGYGVVHGTSFSAPLFAGLLAAILAEQPHLTPAALRSLLPQWLDWDGNVSVLAVLITTYILDPYDPEIETDTIIGAMPYRVVFGFGGDHPIVAAAADVIMLEDTNRVEHELSGESGQAWLNGFGTWDSGGHLQGELTSPFGEIAGVIYFHDDGSASGTGAFSYQEVRSSSIMSGYAGRGPFHGYTAWCQPGLIGDLPAVRAFHWNIPVMVTADPVDGTVNEAGEVPQVEVSFSLGVGATAAQSGTMPPLTLLHDDLDGCPAQLDRLRDYQDGLSGLERRISDPDPAIVPPWGQLEDLFAEYHEALESLHGLLVDASPLSLTDPVVHDAMASTQIAEDSRITARFMTCRVPANCREP